MHWNVLPFAIAKLQRPLDSPLIFLQTADSNGYSCAGTLRRKVHACARHPMVASARPHDGIGVGSTLIVLVVSQAAQTTSSFLLHFINN